MNIGYLTAELRKMCVLDLTEVKSVSELWTRIYLLRYIFDVEL